MGLSHALYAIFHRESIASLRDLGATLNPLFFFIMVICLIPFGMHAEKSSLEKIAVVSVWVAGLLAILLSSDQLFRQDHHEGTLEQWALSPYSLPLLLFFKVMMQWILTCFPLVLAVPFAALFLGLPSECIPVFMLSLMLGTLILHFFNAVIAALLLGLQRGGLLISVLALPFYVPVMILGSQSVYEVLAGQNPLALLMLLAGFFIFTITLAPFAIAYAISLSIE